MPIMFCYIDSFTLNQQVVKLTPGDAEVIFRGKLDDVCDFMAYAYHKDKYDRIVLKGTLAESVVDQIRFQAQVKYNKDDIEIEVLK